MLKADVLAHFKSQAEVAKALAISAQAVSNWGTRVPPLRAAQLHRLTRGKLRFDPDEYQDWYTKNASGPEAA